MLLFILASLYCIGKALPPCVPPTPLPIALDHSGHGHATHAPTPMPPCMPIDTTSTAESTNTAQSTNTVESTNTIKSTNTAQSTDNTAQSTNTISKLAYTNTAIYLQLELNVALLCSLLINI